MKKVVYLMILLILIVKLVGCTKENESDYKKLIIEKRIKTSNDYEKFAEIIDKNLIKEVNDIIKNIKWDNSKVCMVRPPEYKFYFENLKDSIYELWISPNKEQLEIVIESKSKYIQLDEKESNKLLKAFEIYKR